MLSPSTSAICRERLADQLVRGDHEHAVWLGARHVDYTQIPATSRLSEGHPGSVTPGPIFAGLFQYLRDFILVYAMITNVRLSRYGIDVKSDLQTFLILSSVRNPLL